MKELHDLGRSRELQNEAETDENANESEESVKLRVRQSASRETGLDRLWRVIVVKCLLRNEHRP